MPIKAKNGEYQCMFCNFTHPNVFNLDQHQREAHEYYLVPLLKEELVRLLQYFRTGDQELITKRMYDTIKKYATYRIKPPEED